jgi:alkylation response protein AidB-like acyl-CoA dehydrogenase
MIKGISSIELTEEQQMLQKSVRSFMDKHVKPIVHDYEQFKS